MPQTIVLKGPKGHEMFSELAALLAGQNLALGFGEFGAENVVLLDKKIAHCCTQKWTTLGHARS